MYFGGFPNFKGVCPAGGQHDETNSFQYSVAFNAAAGPNMQTGWASCPKCQGLHFAGFPNFKGVCPAGGSHVETNSFAYALPFNVLANAATQTEFRSCKKCLGLFFGPFKGKCPAGGQHDATGSFDYGMTVVSRTPEPTYSFGLDQVSILNQKADTNHSDNDYLSITWYLTNTTTKGIRSQGQKTLRVGGVLHSGDVVPGPFETDPFTINANEVLTVALMMTNLGSTDDSQQQVAQALKVTQAVQDAVVPVVGAIVGAAEGFQVGGEIVVIADGLEKNLGDFLSKIGITVGPPNCNGAVFSATFQYTANQVAQAAGIPGSQTLQGPQENSQCGHAPTTAITFSIKRL
jgi:hypothetical protein